MKRSEMIEAIIYEALSWDGLNTNGVPLDEIASNVLDVCEKHGMLPPERVTNVDSVSGHSIEYKENIWEKEND